MADQDEPVDLYTILGVPKDATASQIKASYYALAKTEHPDRKTDDPHATERFKTITRAYEVLRDTDRRNRYDIYGEDRPNLGERFSVEPGTRLWIWGILYVLFIILYTLSAFNGLAIEWFIPILIHCIVLFVRRAAVERFDIIIWGATLLMYFILPSIFVSKVASFTFLVMAVGIVNIAGIEPDLSVITLFLTFCWEMWMRTVPTNWPFVAAYSLSVSIVGSLASLAYYSELQVAIHDSYIVSHWNPFALFVPIVFTVLYWMDALGGLITPYSLSTYTFPLSWLILALFDVVFFLWLLLARAWRNVGLFLVSVAIGCLVVAPFFPTKLVAFVISFNFLIFLLFLVNALDILLVIIKWKKSHSDVLYLVLGPALLIVDFLSGHYNSLGSAQWIYLGGALSGLAPIVIMFCTQFPEIALATAEVVLKDNKGEASEQTVNDEGDSHSENS